MFWVRLAFKSQEWVKQISRLNVGGHSQICWTKRWRNENSLSTWLLTWDISLLLPLPWDLNYQFSCFPWFSSLHSWTKTYTTSFLGLQFADSRSLEFSASIKHEPILYNKAILKYVYIYVRVFLYWFLYIYSFIFTPLVLFIWRTLNDLL